MKDCLYDKKSKKEKVERCDLLILGAGPAGITAAIYATRYNLKVTVIGKSFGGTANLAGELENWPGFNGSGIELMQKMQKQAEDFGAKFIQSEITKVEKDKKGFYVELGEKVIHGKALIVSLGMEHRQLNVEGEKEFIGKGVSYCATCDGAFFKNKNVAVIGGADSAAKAALYLSEIANKVYVIYRKHELRCEPVAIEKIQNRKNIQVYYFSNPTKIVGEKKVSSLIIKQNCEDKCKEIKLDVDGVFIEVGATPMLEVIKPLNLETDKAGFIIHDRDCKTSHSGVFAAGDNTVTKFKQIVVAAGEGAIATKSAYEYLKYEYKE